MTPVRLIGIQYHHATVADFHRDWLFQKRDCVVEISSIKRKLRHLRPLRAEEMVDHQKLTLRMSQDVADPYSAQRKIDSNKLFDRSRPDSRFDFFDLLASLSLHGFGRQFVLLALPNGWVAVSDSSGRR